MSNVSAWNVEAGSNNAAAPDGAPEGMLRNQVNDVMREMMAALARWYGDTKGALASTGASGAYTVETNSAHASLAAVGIVCFVANHSNPAGGSTLEIDELPAKPLRARLGEALAENTVLDGDTVIALYNPDGDFFTLLYPSPRISLDELRTSQALITPGGRLTLTSGAPVMGNVTGATTVRYAPYVSALLPIYDGANWLVKTFSETSQALNDTTKSPAAAVSNSVYDLFAWNDGGTMRVTRGPAWSDATTPGTGSGTTELERFGGVWVNKFNITNGPAARRGVFVGTIATDGSTQLNFMTAANAAAGGSNARLDVWNMYNRVDVVATSRDSTNSWSFGGTIDTWRSANNSASNRITFVRRFAEDAVRAHYLQPVSTSNSRIGQNGIGLDATDTLSGAAGISQQGDFVVQTMSATYAGIPGVGRHFLQALESGSEASSNVTFRGDNNSPREQMMLTLETRM